MATPASGAVVGAQKLKSIIRLLEDDYAFGKGDRSAWKKVFKKRVLPKYEVFLRKAAKQEARKVSNRMAKGTFIGKGGAGRGNFARSIHVRGEASKFASIFEHGGTIKAKNHQYLTQPLAYNQKKDGTKKKGMRDFPDARTFTITPKNLGQLSGQRVVFYKKGGREVVSRTGKRYIKNPSRIVPLFKLVPSMEISARRWATNAINSAREKIHPYLKESMDKFFSKRRGSV